MMLFHAINDAITIKMFCDLTRIKLNVLVSYPFIKGIAYKILKEFRAMVLLVYLDSGAFSKFTGRATHTRAIRAAGAAVAHATLDPASQTPCRD